MSATPTTNNDLNIDVNIAAWISSNMHSYAIIEEPELIQTFKLLNPTFVPPSSDTIKNRQTQLFLDNEYAVKAFLKNNSSRFSFTLDTWTSSNYKSFLGMKNNFFCASFKIFSSRRYGPFY